MISFLTARQDNRCDRVLAEAEIRQFLPENELCVSPFDVSFAQGGIGEPNSGITHHWRGRIHFRQAKGGIEVSERRPDGAEPARKILSPCGTPRALTFRPLDPFNFFDYIAARKPRLLSGVSWVTACLRDNYS